MSVHDALSETETMHMIHLERKERYAMPSSSSVLSKQPCHIVGRKYSVKPYKI